ncbi:chloramphenicol O-acetyltransferase type B [Aureimonas altamirensis DSM 21988]|uniref:Chloramphenicol acetyltransferase n=1 Tax=Aureimonas altamirensis DSM 21988 TaxID=1121026 RepID=A0ABY1IBS5_9HYPH|nr:type B chloramphenicol O-acetyltransferase [Aureimonas altamirensis]SHI96436.1 chloramphenicol O-acetyltransferase type B [Aureimonas altamirensis DSM 21988]
MHKIFNRPFKGITLDRLVTNPNIRVGRYSYYSGYYHGHGFDDCARFLLPDEGVDKLVIGSFCSIGSGTSVIMDGNQGHRNDWISTFPFFWMPDVSSFEGAKNGFQPAGDTILGNDVWIGTDAIIMPGLTIGHGAVIETRALVNRDVEPYAVVGGNPAKLIRRRFAEDEVEKILELQWWDWSDDVLKQAMPILTSGDISAFNRRWQTVKKPRA